LQDKAGSDPNRVGGPVNPLLSDGGMSTIIAAGKGTDKGVLNNLKRMQARTEVGQDRTLISAFKEIGKICTAMKLADVVKYQANEYYKEVRAAACQCGCGLT
jgi:transcription initiation factor TFIIB